MLEHFLYREMSDRFEWGVVPLPYAVWFDGEKGARKALYNGFLSFSLHFVSLGHFENLFNVSEQVGSSVTKMLLYFKNYSRMVSNSTRTTLRSYLGFTTNGVVEEKRISYNIATYTSSGRLFSRNGSRSSDVPFIRDFRNHSHSTFRAFIVRKYDSDW